MSENQTVELTYNFDESAIQATQHFMCTQGKDGYMSQNIFQWVPEAHIEFTVGGVFVLLPFPTFRLPLLEFAWSLRKLVYRLEVNKTLRLDVVLTGHVSSFTLNNDQTVMVQGGLKSTGHCTLVELRIATDQFCHKVYEDILRLFPDYFQFMDLLPPGKGSTEGKPSEKFINELLGRQ